MPSRSREAVAGRIRSAQPPASSWNIVITSTRSACSASARTAGSAAASSPDTTRTPDRLRFRLLAVGRCGPGRGRPASVRGHREMDSAGARLALEPELVRELGDPCSTASAWARPDENGPLRLSQPSAELVFRRRQLTAKSWSAARWGLHRAGRRAVDDLRATAARFLDPEIDDRRALDDGVVADDDDELRLGDRGQRQAERFEDIRRRLGEDGRVSRLPRAGDARARRRIVSEPESAVTIPPSVSRSIISAASSASSQETSSSPSGHA